MKVSIILVSLLFFMSCVTNKVYFVERPDMYVPPSKKISQPFFLYGIGQEQTVNVSDACGTKKPEWAKTKFTFVDLLLELVTLGIYTPRTVEIYCK
jgi:hypothetical protein